MPRRPAASPPTPPRRSPSEPSRRLEGAKVEKLRKQSSGVSEMEEGEVAPDPEPKGRNLGTQGKGVTGAPAADNAGKEERKSKDGVVVEAGQVTNTRDEKSAPEVAEKVGGDEVPVQDETANVVDQMDPAGGSSRLRNFAWCISRVAISYSNVENLLTIMYLAVRILYQMTQLQDV